MITDEAVGEALDRLSTSSLPAAKARAERIYVEEYRKTIKAQIMAEHADLPIGAQEREAYADDRYIRHLDAIREAVTEDERLRFLREAAVATIEAWRDSVIKRAGRKIMKVKVSTDKVNLADWTWGVDMKVLDKAISKQVTAVLREQLANDVYGLDCWIRPEGVIVIDLPFGDNIGDVKVEISFKALMDDFLETYEDDPEHVRMLITALENAAKQLAP